MTITNFILTFGRNCYRFLSYQLLKAKGNRQSRKRQNLAIQFSYLKRRLETKHIKAFSLTN
ncbi:MAG: hypothetical protein ACKPKR_04250 [Microcystis panniformis]